MTVTTVTEVRSVEDVRAPYVRQRMLALWHGARHEVVLMAAHDTVPHRELAAGLLHMAHEGPDVAVRVLVEEGDSAGLCDTGVPGEVRTVRAVHGYLMIVDRSLAVVPFSAPAPGGAAVIVRTPTIVHLLRATFERNWNAARAVRGNRFGTLSPLQRTIVQHVANGMTDEAIARRIGLCSRTIRRHVTAVMRALGARSRAELGMLAMANGLVSPSN